jgi:competence protein ComEC
MQQPPATAGGLDVSAALFSWMPGFVAGCVAQLQQAYLLEGRIYAIFVLLPFVLHTFFAINKVANCGARVVLWMILAASLGFGLTGLRASIFASQALSPALEGKDLVVTGMVSAMPQRNESGLRFRLSVESAALDGDAVRIPPRVYLSWYVAGVVPQSDSMRSLQRQPADLGAGERWQMAVRLKAPHGNSNPHGFDYELWLWEQGLQATGYVRAGPKDPAPQRLDATWRHPVEQVRQRVKDTIYAQVGDRRAAGLIAALVVGDQSAIERADWDVFRATGVAHLMSISGLHVTMFAWLAALLVGWLWRRSEALCLAFPAPSAALLGGLLLATAYAVFSGWGVPSQRTIWMLATVGLLRFWGKHWPWPHVWMLACAVVVAIDPWALLQPGFWLSFCAVGVLFATDSGAARAYPTRAGGQFVSMLREQWVITLGLAPLTLLLFGQVSVVGLVANAVAIPWVTLVVTPLAMLGAVFGPVWAVVVWAINALSWCLQQFAAVPFAVLSVAQAPLWAGLAAVLGGVLLVLRLPWSVRVLGLPMMLPVLLWQAPRPSVGEFELLAADIGQGNAVIVRTANHALVYDTGPRFSLESDAGHRVLVPLLRALGVTVDTVMLSHRDTDHVGGALAVLAMQPQAELMSSIEDGHELRLVRPVKRCVAGQTWTWDGVRFEVLHPRAQDYAVPGQTALPKSNTMSCVLRIASRNDAQAALLTGDIEAAQEARLVAGAAPLKSDWLLMPHHGSKTSSSPAFVDAVHPKLALVQAGYRNRFGHPVAPVMERYRQRGIEVVNSARCGAATWRSDHPRAIACERTTGARYWHHLMP